jgi:hypothetical protein
MAIILAVATGVTTTGNKVRVFHYILEPCRL